MYKIIIENIEYTPTNKMAVRTLSRALSIIEWLNVPAASIMRAQIEIFKVSFVMPNYFTVNHVISVVN